MSDFTMYLRKLNFIVFTYGMSNKIDNMEKRYKLSAKKLDFMEVSQALHENKVAIEKAVELPPSDKLHKASSQTEKT